MQQSSQVLFCGECGLANEPEAIYCSACQKLLVRADRESGSPASAPLAVAPSPAREVTPGLLFAADSQSAASAVGPGTLLAECYLLKEEIGRGGFSIVYRAVEVDDQSRQVAIKRIPLSELTPSQVIDATETFNREITMLTRFSEQRGVPKFYGHLTDQENWYLIMEYIEGETLEACLQRKSLGSLAEKYLQKSPAAPLVEKYLQRSPAGYFDEERTIRIGMDLALILNDLHTSQPPVIFRDVKPANIMLTPDQDLFLIDFGIARDFRWGKARDTKPLGSPGFAAPEQYGHSQTSRRTDVYGLGATLQTLITGRDPLELASGEAPRNPQPPSPELRALLDEMLSSDPFQRPIDMSYVHMRLESIAPPQEEPATNSNYGQLSIAIFLFALMVLFTLVSITAVWLGFLCLANVGISLIIYKKWTQNIPYIGLITAWAGREIAIYSWLLFVVLWVALGFVHLFTYMHF